MHAHLCIVVYKYKTRLNYFLYHISDVNFFNGRILIKSNFTDDNCKYSTVFSTILNSILLPAIIEHKISCFSREATSENLIFFHMIKS